MQQCTSNTYGPIGPIGPGRKKYINKVLCGLIDFLLLKCKKILIES